MEGILVVIIAVICIICFFNWIKNFEKRFEEKYHTDSFMPLYGVAWVVVIFYYSFLQECNVTWIVTLAAISLLYVIIKSITNIKRYSFKTSIGLAVINTCYALSFVLFISGIVSLGNKLTGGE